LRLLAIDGKARCLTGLGAVDMRSWVASVVKDRRAVLGRSWMVVSVEDHFFATTWCRLSGSDEFGASCQCGALQGLNGSETVLWWSRIPLASGTLGRGGQTVRPIVNLDGVACFSRIDKCKVRSEETRKLEGQAAVRGEVNFGTAVDQTAKRKRRSRRPGWAGLARGAKFGAAGGVSI